MFVVWFCGVLLSWVFLVCLGSFGFAVVVWEVFCLFVFVKPHLRKWSVFYALLV